MAWQTPKSRLSQILAYMMSFALLNVITVCPVPAHQVPVGHTCCEHSSRHSMPCTDNTSNACPYSLLEKSQAKLSVLALLLTPAPSARAEANRPIVWFSALAGPRYEVDLSTTYLRLRVLLI